MARFCDNCGSPLKEGAQFCDKCGHKAVAETRHNDKFVMMCPNCKAAVENPMGLCPYCGKPLNEDPEEKAFKTLVYVVVAVIVIVILLSLIAGFALIAMS